jgi:putative restriction endonuclease
MARVRIVRAFVGVTDSSWYEFLRARPQITEVNFWRPGGGGFRAIGTGDPFLFKTHHPHNRLVGVGFFSGPARLKLSEAWDVYGEGNGAASIHEMRRRISYYRRAPMEELDDPTIGCVLLRDVSFVPPDEGLPAPPDFARNIVTGKTYDLTVSTGSYVEDALTALIASHGYPAEVPGPVFGEPALAKTRVGQRAFKALVLEAYQRRCAVTGARITPALDAAHIRPVAEEGENRVSNGLLLRADVHKLFDRGYLGVHPRTLTLQVSPRLKADFGNGAEFYRRHGQPLTSLPARRLDRPDRDALTWHMEARFRAH